MTEIIKTCLTHGALTASQVNKNTSRGKVSYRCKLCQKEAHRKYYEQNKEVVLKKNQSYRDLDADKRKEQKRKSWHKHKEKYALRERDHHSAWLLRSTGWRREKEIENRRKYREELNPVYVRDLLTRGSPLSAKDLPKDLVECYKSIMMLKRELKVKKVEQATKKYK